MYVFTLWLCLRVYFLMVFELAGALGRRLGTPGGSAGAAWFSLGHLGGAMGHGKRTDDETWCAIVMRFLELLIFHWFYNVFSRGCESWLENR